MEHAGVVAGVQAVAAGPAFLAVTEVGGVVPQFLQLPSDHTDICLPPRILLFSILIPPYNC